MPEKQYHEVEIKSIFSEAKGVEETIVKEAESLGYGGEEIFAVRLSLEEALSNAIRHGNVGDVNKKIHIRFRVDMKCIDIYIGDEGTGFNPEAIPDPTSPEQLECPSGRGIMLMRAYMNQVEYNQRGNEVRLIKRSKAG